MPGLKALAHMDANQVLNQLSREQLVSLLYEILRRLLSPGQPPYPADAPCHATPKQDGQLVIDPTIDAWEHTGIYPQGYNPPSTREFGRSEDARSSSVPRFGGPTWDMGAMPVSAAVGAIFGGLSLHCIQQALATWIPSIYSRSSDFDNCKSPSV